MNYELKDKLILSADMLKELEMRGWQEIEYLQAQIANLAEGGVNDKLRQLFKSLLTSYYIFTGGIETLKDEPIYGPAHSIEPQQEVTDITVTDDSSIETADAFEMVDTDSVEVPDTIDPFEYFTDFDDPIGEPLTDEDLYNN